EAADDGRPAETLLASSGYRYVVVTGVGADVPDLGFLMPLVRAMSVEQAAPVVVAAAATGGDAEEVAADRGIVMDPWRTDDELDERISTVDDLELFPGLMAVVFSIEDLSTSRRGHYGVGSGAESLLP